MELLIGKRALLAALACLAPRALADPFYQRRADQASCTPYSINDQLIGGGPPGRNVLNNTCNRLWQQAVLKDDSLWIDGGAQYYTNWANNDPVSYVRGNGSITAAQNQYLIQVPTNYTWDWKCNITEIAHEKNVNPMTGSPPPIVIHGTVYEGLANDSRIWLFGGTTFSGNTSAAANYSIPLVDQYSLWSYDLPTGVWGQTDVTLAAPRRPFNGFSAEANDKALAFWINGALNNGSSLYSSSVTGNNTEFLTGMLSIDFGNPSGPVASNLTGPPWGDPRAGGLMHYVPNYGTAGLLVAFGGTTKPANTPTPAPSGTYVPMTEIWLLDLAKFDRASGTLAPEAWVSQNTTGTPPGMREDSCVVGLAAADNSSYQLYVYGGRQNDNVYDDVWALSLPQFTWTRTYAGTAPRFGHSCQLYKNWQMITIGGASSTALDSCDWESRGVAIFDFSTSTSSNWGSVFRASNSPPTYKVPQPVYHDIGGDANGGANKIAPASGWASSQVQALFAPSAPRASPSGLSGGAIAGIVIGALAAAALLAALVYLLLRRPRPARADPTAASEAGIKRPDMASHSSNGASSLADGAALHQIDTAAERYEADSRPKRAELPTDEAEVGACHEMDAAGAEVIELSGADKYDPARKAFR